MLKNYLVLMEALEKISEDSCTSDARAKAAGLSTCMEQFRTYFGLRMCHLVFSATEQLATTLQGKTITAEVATQARDAAMAYLERQRCEEAFTNLLFKRQVIKQTNRSCHDQKEYLDE